MIRVLLAGITTGLRVGELLAMKWGNLDWNIEKCYVKETMLRAGGGHASGFAPPKTDTSVAPTNLTPSSIKALQQHRRRQPEYRLEAGGSYQDIDLISATSAGTPSDSCNIVKKIFHPSFKAGGLHRIRFHDLRPTCASFLINQGESPKYIQSQLLHTSIDMTFDRYGIYSRVRARRLQHAWMKHCSVFKKGWKGRHSEKPWNCANRGCGYLDSAAMRDARVTTDES